MSASRAHTGEQQTHLHDSTFLTDYHIYLFFLFFIFLGIYDKEALFGTSVIRVNARERIESPARALGKSTDKT